MAKRSRNSIAEALAAKQRSQLQRQEEREQRRREHDQVQQGLSETVALGSLRGSEYDEPQNKPGDRAKPIRKLSGLETIAKKGLASDDQLIAGGLYASSYQATQAAGSIRSILNDTQSLGSRSLVSIVGRAHSNLAHQERLTAYRKALQSPLLVKACDLILGEGYTPRECAENGRTSEGIEALVIAALEILAESFADTQTPRKAIS